MATAILGKISEFNEEVETFDNYCERLEHFVTINKIDSDKKVSSFISIIGPALFTTLKDLLHPKKISEVSYDDMVKILKAHFVPKCNITYERFVFYKRLQKEGESILEYSCQLKKLATKCNFGSFLNEALRDKFLCGLRSSTIQSKLLAEGDSLTFENALELALVVENADKNARYLHPDKYSEEISYVRPTCLQSNGRPKPTANVRMGAGGRPSPHSQDKCFRCGRFHDPQSCPCKDFTCFSCNRKGHLASVCKAKRSSTSRPNFKQKHHNKVYMCEHESDEDVGESPSQSMNEELELFTIAYSNSDKTCFTVNMTVNNKPLDMVIDTGAAVTVMPDQVYYEKYHSESTKLYDSSVKLKTYTGERINVLGEFQAVVQTADKEQHKLPIVVVKSTATNQPTLLGRNWMERIRLNWSIVKSNSTSDDGQTSDPGVYRLNGKSVPSTIIDSLDDIKKKYASVFDQPRQQLKVDKTFSQPCHCQG